MLNNGLPSISNLESTAKREKENLKKKSDEERIVAAMSIFKKHIKANSNQGSAQIINTIPSEMLFVAPRSFFYKYDKLVKEITSKIQTSISNQDKAITISNVKKDPTNYEKRRLALFAISNELIKPEIANMIKAEDTTERDLIYALVANEIVGFGPLEPLWNDKSVTEIICVGPHDIQVEMGGQIRRVPGAHFRDFEHIDSLIRSLYNSIDREVSRTVPLAQGRLHDNSRMFVTMPPVAPDGPNFNIRRHKEKYWTPQDIINMGTASVELMTFIGNLIHSGASFLVIGGTGTGKTTLLNSLTGFFKETDRIVTLEKSLELKPHPKKLFAAPLETVSGRVGSINDGVKMRDLVEAAMIMRPDGIVIGEVIDGAAYDLCQALNTGHWGASTIHSDSAEDGVVRLMSLVSQEDLIKGESTLRLISTAFDFIIVVNRFDDGSRKIAEVHEVAMSPERNNEGELYLPTVPLWEFIADDIDYDGSSSKEIRVTGDWVKYADLSDKRKRKLRLNLKPQLTWAELNELSSLTPRKDELL